MAKKPNKADLVFTKMSWEEFGMHCDVVYMQVLEYLEATHQKLELIIPMLREGGFLGLTLAYKFNIWKVLPLHSKHFFQNNKYVIKPCTDFPKLHYTVSDKPLILITDALTFSGYSSSLALEQVKSRFPKAKFLYASILKDYTTDDHKSFERTFHSILGDDKNVLSKEAAKKLHIDKKTYLLPWQNEEEERAAILKYAYKYEQEI